MRIEEGLHLVMSGAAGFELTDRLDCNVFLIGAGDDWVMFDAGAGRDTARVMEVLAADGIEPRRIRHLFLTHGHADHSGGAAHWREACGAKVYAGAATAAMVSVGDEAGISLDRARRAGVYPDDYRYASCPIDQVLAGDDAIRLGDIVLRMVPTPGHSADHVSYLVETPSRQALIAGDALFHGGKVAIQDIADCDVAAACASVRRLAGTEFDALLPGHLAFSVRGGRRHAEAALSHVRELRCPPSIM